MSQPTVLCEAKHLRLLSREGWEYVERPNSTGIVVVFALTPENKVLLIEQPRRAFGKSFIEFPAGLAGDGDRGESMAAAARRELIEETGYDADHFEIVGQGAPSAGLCTEYVTLLRATGLRKVTGGGGVEGEQITVHEVPLGEVPAFLDAQVAQGKLLDVKLYAGLYFLMATR